jgi:hypothetical protein
MLTTLLLAGATSFAIPLSDGATHAAAQSPGMEVTMVTAGAVDPNGIIPALNGVPGAGVYNWDIALPVTVLNGGQNYVLEAMVNDNNYTGPCKGYLELTQVQSGKKVVLAKFVFWSKEDCTAGFGYGGENEFTIPASPGPAMLSGVIKYGGSKNVMNVPMVIQ